MATRQVSSIAELMSPQVRAIIDKAEIEAKGVFEMPPLDLDAIKSRADELDAKSQTKADIYMLLHEVNRLNGNA